MPTIRTDPKSAAHALAKDVLTKLPSLRKRVRTATPYMLLVDAIAVLHVRATGIFSPRDPGHLAAPRRGISRSTRA